MLLLQGSSSLGELLAACLCRWGLAAGSFFFCELQQSACVVSSWIWECLHFFFPNGCCSGTVKHLFCWCVGSSYITSGDGYGSRSATVATPIITKGSRNSVENSLILLIYGISLPYSVVCWTSCNNCFGDIGGLDPEGALEGVWSLQLQVLPGASP